MRSRLFASQVGHVNRHAPAQLQPSFSFAAATAGDPTDASTKALIDTIGDAGFNVQLRTDNGRHVVEATNGRTRATLVVTGDDLYTVVVELAGQVGMDVMDG